LTHPQNEITKPTLGFKFICSEVFEKKLKIDKIQAGNNEITTTKLGYCLGPQYSMPSLSTQMQDKLSGFLHFHVKYIFFCNRWRTSQPFNKQASKLITAQRPSFNSLPTPCHSSYLSFGALALTVANNTAHIPSTPSLFQVPDNLDIGAPTL
jgi:hypothetical protein